MSGPDESAEDVRAIRAILQRKTETGLKALPAFDQVTWDNAQFLIGYTQDDGEKVHAHYVKKSGSSDGAKAHNYYKEGSTTTLSSEEWNGMKYEVPICYIMDSELGDADKKNLVSAFVKACFSMRGVTKGAAYYPTGNFKQALGRAMSILMQKENGEDATVEDDDPQTPSPIDSLEESALTFDAPLPAARNGRLKELAYRPRGMSSSATVDFDDGRGKVRKYELGTLNLTRGDQAKTFSLKRKPLEMFSDMNRAKHVKKELGEGSNNAGKRLTRKSEASHRGPITSKDNDGPLLVPEVSRTERLSQIGNGAALPLVSPSSGSNFYQTATEELDIEHQLSTHSSKKSSSAKELSQQQDQSRDLFLHLRSGAKLHQNKTRGLNMQRQVKEYMEKETFIEGGAAQIKLHKKNIEAHKKKQQALKADLQALEAEADARNNEIWKSIEAQLASVDKGLRDGRSRVLELLEEDIKQQEEEEAKIKEKSRVMVVTMDELKAMKQAGGFELGGAVFEEKRQWKN